MSIQTVKKSKTRRILSGVPQGSILGPLLFCLFINDLPLTNNNKTTTNDMFADDSSLYTSDKQLTVIEQNLQTSLNHVSSWCRNNSMILNPKKSKCMLIATRQRGLGNADLNLYVFDKAIEKVSSHKVLGVTVDSELKWLPHIEQIHKKLTRNVYLLSQLKTYVDVELLKIFFYAHILPHINYASSVWDGCAEDHKQRLNSLYRRAAKLILFKEETDTDSKLKALGFLSLSEQLFYNKAIFVFKILNFEAPPYLEAFICKATSRYGSLNLIKPLSHIDLFQTSIAFSGADTCNQLPNNIKTIKSITSFKQAVNEYIKSKRPI